MKSTLTLLILCFLVHTVSAYEKAFLKTDVGQLEIKTLPAAHLIASRTDQPYFENGNGLFRPLFRYISSNDISMTTPVEAEINPGVMYFYIGKEGVAKAQEGNDQVSVLQFPERMVASIGARGSYSEKNFSKAEAKLKQWLAKQTDYKISGEARGIFWNGPFTLGFLKRFEVHIPIEKQ